MPTRPVTTSPEGALVRFLTDCCCRYVDIVFVLWYCVDSAGTVTVCLWSMRLTRRTISLAEIQCWKWVSSCKTNNSGCHENDSIPCLAGVDKYNDLCRGIVNRYTAEWEIQVTRLGRWIDFKNDYRTMDPEFMESVW
jgi:hypothetical protein